MAENESQKQTSMSETTLDKETGVGNGNENRNVDIVFGDRDASENGRYTPRLRLSSSILLYVAGVVVAATVAMASVQGKVDHLMETRQSEEATISQILRRVTDLQAKVEYLTEELRYIRAKTDRITEKEKP